MGGFRDQLHHHLDDDHMDVGGGGGDRRYGGGHGGPGGGGRDYGGGAHNGAGGGFNMFNGGGKQQNGGGGGGPGAGAGGMHPGMGFRKPAPQCVFWENRRHRQETGCTLWHPRESCRFFPGCAHQAQDCGFAHPFCGPVCVCLPGERNPQMNHWTEHLQKSFGTLPHE